MPTRISLVDPSEDEKARLRLIEAGEGVEFELIEPDPGSPEHIIRITGTGGPAGESAYQSALDEGFVGTREEWLITLIGPQGMSAYEVAVEEGFEGTVEEWLESLVGPKGDKGDGIFITGWVEDAANLPVTGEIDDYWIDTDTGHLWTWNGQTWIDLGPFRGPEGPVGPQGPRGEPDVLSDLSDVDTTGALTNQFLGFDGDQWIPMDLQHARNFFVCGAAAPGGNGSFNRPYRLLQSAIEQANDEHGTIINIIPGGNQGPANIAGRSNIMIQGMGTTDSQVVQITSPVSITGTSTRVRFKDISFKMDEPTDVALTLDGTMGRHYFENVSIAAGTADSVVLEGTNANWIVFNNCHINGRIRLAGTPAANTTVYLHEGGTPSTNLDIAGPYKVLVAKAKRWGHITHTEGFLTVDGMGEITPDAFGRAITSTASDDGLSKLILSNVNLFRSVTGGFGNIYKTGSCPWFFANVNRRPRHEDRLEDPNDIQINIDRVEGDRQGFWGTAKDLAANFTAHSYLHEDDSVHSHLVGIEERLSRHTVKEMEFRWRWREASPGEYICETTLGNLFAGWLALPTEYTSAELADGVKVRATIPYNMLVDRVIEFDGSGWAMRMEPGEQILVGPLDDDGTPQAEDDTREITIILKRTPAGFEDNYPQNLGPTEFGDNAVTSIGLLMIGI